jgi:hypothetical protein
MNKCGNPGSVCPCSEETFQREIMCGMLTAYSGDCLLWNTERTVSQDLHPSAAHTSMADKGCRDLLKKVRFRRMRHVNVTIHVCCQVKKELLPCLRSFTSSLRVAELVWREGTLIKDYPPEAYKYVQKGVVNAHASVDNVDAA